MPLPANVSTVEVTGTFTDADGSPATGEVFLDPVPDYLLDATAGPPTTIALERYVFKLDTNGEIPAGSEVIATDDADLNPTGWTYKVVINLRSSGKRIEFFMLAPAGPAIDLVLASPVDSDMGTPTVVGPQGPPGTGALAASIPTTRAGTSTNEWVNPAGLAGTLPFAPVDASTTTPATITALSTALNAATDGGEIALRPGVYTIDAATDLADGTHLKGGPGVIFEWDDSSPDYPMFIQGIEGAHTALGVNATAGAYTVTLPTGAGAGFAVDDVIGLISTTVVAGTAGRARELHQVLSVTGDVVTLDAPLYFSYLTAASAAFFKQSPKKDITIEGITFRWSAAAVKMRGPLISRAIRCHFRDITVVNGPGIALDDAINCSVSNIVVDGSKEYATAYLVGSYGVSVSGSGHGVVVNGGTFRATRHAVTTVYYQDGANLYTGPFDTVFANLVGWGGPESFAVFDTHSYAHNTLFNGCRAVGPGQAATPGFQDRGVRTTIANCSVRGSNRGITLTTDSADAFITGCDIAFIDTGTAPAGVVVSGPGAVIRGNRFKNCKNGVSLGSTGTNALIENNEFVGISGDVFIADGAGSDVGQIVKGNVMRVASGVIGFNGFRGLAIDNILLGTTFGFFTTTNARMTKAIDPPTTVTYAATVTPNPTYVNCISVTQTGNITIANPSTNNTVKGCTFRVILIQDGVGGRTVTWGAAYKVITAAITTAAKTNVWDFQYDGTSWLEVSAAAGI